MTIFAMKEKPGNNDLCLITIYDINTNYINNALNHPAYATEITMAQIMWVLLNIYAVFIAHTITSIVATSAATISLTASPFKSLKKCF